MEKRAKTVKMGIEEHNSIKFVFMEVHIFGRDENKMNDEQNERGCDLEKVFPSHVHRASGKFSVFMHTS